MYFNDAKALNQQADKEIRKELSKIKKRVILSKILKVFIKILTYLLFVPVFLCIYLSLVGLPWDGLLWASLLVVVILSLIHVLDKQLVKIEIQLKGPEFSISIYDGATNTVLDDSDFNAMVYGSPPDIERIDEALEKEFFFYWDDFIERKYFNRIMKLMPNDGLNVLHAYQVPIEQKKSLQDILILPDLTFSIDGMGESPRVNSTVMLPEFTKLGEEPKPFKAEWKKNDDKSTGDEESDLL